MAPGCRVLWVLASHLVVGLLIWGREKGRVRALGTALSLGAPGFLRKNYSLGLALPQEDPLGSEGRA